ncbi:hypothetical protein [Microbacterium sp.]|uniref:hypothetical protein n=1 Tax=Microbacterium sp. TaxID=51671 RepID=UPI001AD54D35|nr:hypothetical protein [Microbacterium sp.]MBN9158157.1 hypothetical protein [Microbacterium sp.]
MRRRTSRPFRARAAVVLVLAGLCLTGCSQAQALAPVGGDRLAAVRFGTLDALVEAEVEVRSAPTCEQKPDDTVSCTGTASDGREISAISRGTSPDIEVVVGGETVYSGSLTDLLDRAAGEAG